MNFMIKPKYQYFLLPLSFSIIAIISVINYIQVKKYKYSLFTILLTGVIYLLTMQYIPAIVIENFQIENSTLSLYDIVYTEVLNFGIGYLLIKNQKKNIKFV